MVAALALPAVEVPRMAWGSFVEDLEWAQGEHVAIVGPTGMGKTTLVLALVPLRKWVTITATKPADDTLAGLRRQGWQVIDRWPPSPGQRKVVLWPRQTSLTFVDGVRKAVADGLQAIYRAGAWCIVLDDLQALTDTIKIGPQVRNLLINARSKGITVVASTQRPRWVPREVWTQATHLFIGRCTDRDDLRALAGLGHADTDTVRRTVQNLDLHEVLYVNTRTGRLAITQAPPPGRR